MSVEDDIAALQKGLRFFDQLKGKNMTTFTTEDREYAMKKEAWKEAYDDWARLLDTAKATDLLQDPEAVFDEAWRQATFVVSQLIAAQLPEDEAKELSTYIFRKMLK
jgi:hypothetical protein